MTIRSILEEVWHTYKLYIGRFQVNFSFSHVSLGQHSQYHIYGGNEQYDDEDNDDDDDEDNDDDDDDDS